MNPHTRPGVALALVVVLVFAGCSEGAGGGSGAGGGANASGGGGMANVGGGAAASSELAASGAQAGNPQPLQPRRAVINLG